MYDLLVIGGGVNGAGIARDAAGRGARVLLCEKDDLARHTSSASTKLIHGGLRYLENFEFRLVREALKEREVLLRNAPHIIWPLRFILPFHSELRPSWILRAGLFLYDHIGGRKSLPGTKRVGLEDGLLKGVLNSRFKFGFEYSDCWVEDARLVVLNAVDAAERGAEICTRVRCIALQRDGSVWKATLEQPSGLQRSVRARAIVNAAGPWVEDVVNMSAPDWAEKSVRLVKGSHIVVRKLYDDDRCFIFQNADSRIVFAIPYEREFTLVGTTDLSFEGDRDNIVISETEVAYICEAANEYFDKAISPDDVVSHYAGVRPLYDDRQASNSVVTRDYVFDVQADNDRAPILSVYGGKITTYRKLAEHALEKLSPFLSFDSDSWTHASPLPGGDIDGADFGAFSKAVKTRLNWAPANLVERWARYYGTRIDDMLGAASSLSDLGEHFGGGLYEREVRFLIDREFAVECDDILWRRTKLGLHISDTERRKLEIWFEHRCAA